MCQNSLGRLRHAAGSDNGTSRMLDSAAFRFIIASVRGLRRASYSRGRVHVSLEPGGLPGVELCAPAADRWLTPLEAARITLAVSLLAAMIETDPARPDFPRVSSRDPTSPPSTATAGPRSSPARRRTKGRRLNVSTRSLLNSRCRRKRAERSSDS